MEIEINKTQTELNLKISGSIDSVTAPQLEAQLKQNMEGITAMNIDFKDVEYISSAGLRIMIFAKKSIGDLKLINLNDDVKDVFKMTGFDVIFGL